MSGRTVLALVVAAVIVAGRGTAFAASACNAGSACTFADLPAACCNATSCTIDGTITTAAAVCDLDFGPRNVTVTATGMIVLGSNTLSIEAGSLTVAGTINGRGTSPNHGGRLVVTTNGGAASAFRLTGSAAVVDVSGFSDGGGSIEVHADGPVDILGGTILASQLEPNASGGSILIDTTAGAVTVSAPVRADAGVNGIGGLIDLSAATDLTITDTGLVSVAGGAGFGGEIDLEAPGTLTMTAAASAQATGLTNSGGDGGEIDLTAGSVAVTGYLEAKGGSDSTGTLGGSGGTVSVEADTGPLTLGGTQGIVTDGAGGGDGGEVDLLTQSATTGNLQIGTMTGHLGVVSASGSGGVANSPVSGGEVDASSAASLTVTRKILVTGAGAGGGDVEFFGQQDVLIVNTIDGSDPTGGGSLDVGSGHDIVVTDVGFGTPLRMNATTNGDGGSISIIAGNDLSIGTTTAGSTTLNVSGAGAGAGRFITLTAGRDLKILKNGTVFAKTPLTSTREGGQILITAGSPDQTGNLQIDGQVDDGGRASSAVAHPASIQLSGCTITISNTGTVDSSGDVGSFNTVIARKALSIAGHLTSTASNGGGQNIASYPNGAAPTVSGSVSPAFTCGPAGCTLPFCTAQNPSPGTPPCLVPCPDCPNTADPTHGQYPEQCGTPGCSADCDLHCRQLVCDDQNSCTTDRCDDTTFPYPTCFNDPEPSGTSCDDNTVCNGRETCVLQDGFAVCAMGTALDCDDGNPCTADACDAVNGCSNTPLTGAPAAGSTGCSDQCTQTCNAGVCVPKTPPNCDDGNPNTIDFCDPTTGLCQHGGPRPCSQGCDDGNPCTSEQCDAGTQNCVYTFVVGTPAGCGDTNICNGTEQCQNGACTGIASNCDDGNPCTDDACTVTGCTHTPIPNCCVPGDTCADGNDCTSDSCVDNHCEHDLIPNCCDTNADCDDGNPCTTDSACANHRCTHTPLADGSTPAGCDDVCSDPPAQCQSGVCVSSPKVCPSDGACPEICDPSSGTCVRPAPACSGPNGHPLPCCCASDADCDDGDPCTHDTCDPDSNSCTNELLFTDCQACSVDTDCDMQGACGQHICCTSAADPRCPFAVGVCTQDGAYTAPDCLTGNTKLKSNCVVDGPGQAHCTAPVCTCDDHNPCNGVETCGQNVCVPGTLPDCDDHDSCTDDACDPAVGCTHTARTGFDSVSCRLDAIALDLQQATAAAIRPPVRSKISKLLGKARIKLSAAHGTSGKKAIKNLKAASSALNAIGNAVASARHKNKIDGGLADAITTSAQGAAAAIDTLKTSITPA